MPDFDRALREALQNIPSEFRENELAYLATTTKVELPFRDRLAFLLHQKFNECGLLVAREWDRVDIGIVDSNNSPHCLIELKAMYTFDALKNLSKFTDATSADEVKARRLAEPYTAVYSLLLATHLDKSVQPDFIKVVKYSAGINNAILKHQNSDAVGSSAKNAVDENLRGRNVIDSGIMSAGRYFGMKVDIFYWLVRDASENGPQ